MRKKSQLSIVGSVSAFLLVLAGCGGGGSSSTTTTTLTGNAAKGYIANGLVEVFEVSSGVEGTRAIASGTTDASGDFSISVPVTTNPVVIKVSRKDATTTILDETTGNRETMPADFTMKSFADDLSTQRIASINPYTDLAVKNLPSGKITPTAVAQSATWVKDNYLGGEADPFKVTPAKGTGATAEQKVLYARLSEIAALKADAACAGKTGGEALTCGVDIVRQSATFTVDTSGQVSATRDATKVAKLNSATLPASLQAELGSAATKPTSLANMANPSASIASVITPTEASAVQYAQDLSEASRKFKKFLDTFGGKIDDLSALAVGTDLGVSYLLDTLGKLCEYSKESKSLICSGSLNWSQGDILTYTDSTGYRLSITGSANNYTYTISGPAAASYLGTIVFSQNTVTLSGKVPELYKVNNLSKVREATLGASFGISILDQSSLADGDAVSGSFSFSYSAAANSDLKAASATLEGALSGTYNASLKEIEAVTITGKTVLSVDSNSFTGTVSVKTKIYPVGTLNKKRQEQIDATSLTGKFELKTGETATGSLTVLPNFSQVNFAALPSPTNFGTGTATASLEVYDSSQKNYAKITLDASRSEYATGTQTLKMRLGTDETKRWIAFTSTATLDTSNVNYYIPLNIERGLNPDIKITSSGGYTGVYVSSSRATNSAGIVNSDGTKVGAIRNNQLFIGNSVSPILFE